MANSDEKNSVSTVFNIIDDVTSGFETKQNPDLIKIVYIFSISQKL
jgi:hypothetical protein